MIRTGQSTRTILIAVVLLSVVVPATVVGPALAQEGSASLPETTVTQERGDVAELTVNLTNTDEAFVEIGSDDAGYHVVARVTDGDRDNDTQVTLTLNTYFARQNLNTAGLGLTAASAADGDTVSVERVFAPDEPVAEPLSTGSYPVAVGVSRNAATDRPQPQDEGEIRVVERSTGDARTWTAPEAAIEFDTRQEFLNKLRGNFSEAARVVTQTDRIAKEDWLIVQFNVSGIYGLVQTRHALTGVDPQGNATGVSVTVQEENPEAGEEPRRVNLSDRDNVLLTDDANNTMFLVLTTEADAFQPDTAYRATLEINESSRLVPNGSAPQVATTTFLITERQASFTGLTDGELRLERGQRVPVSGTTTLAPNSEVAVSLNREGEAPFTMTRTATVTENRTFTARFNLTQLSVGTNVTARVVSGDQQISQNVTGRIVQPANATETPEGTPTETSPTPTTTATESPTETGTQTGTSPTPTASPTPTGQPGFGVTVALVALALAALVARRR